MFRRLTSRSRIEVVALLTTLLFAPPALAERLTLRIDADFSVNANGARAIALGIDTALAEIGARIGDLELVVEQVDHHGNPRRSIKHLDAAAADPTVLAVYGGVHSPPYMMHREEISNSGLPLLLPWSAGGPITRRAEDGTNTIFRLSIDDTKSARFLADWAVERAACKMVDLVLLDTSWGRANREPLVRHLTALGLPDPAIQILPMNPGASRIKEIVDGLLSRDPDCVVFLGTSTQAVALLPALQDAMPALRVISHWGLISGEFTQMTEPTVWRNMDISILSTCGLDAIASGRGQAHAAMESIGTEDGEGRPLLGDIPAFPGFVHGYDLTRILIQGIRQAQSDPEWRDGDIRAKRRLLVMALENLDEPVEGFLKVYHHPFAPYSTVSPDSHEALSGADLCMVRFAEDGGLEAITDG